MNTSAAVKALYHEQGYFVFDSFVPHVLCDEIKEAAASLVQKIVPAYLPDAETVAEPAFSWEQFYDDCKRRLCFFFEHAPSTAPGAFQYEGKPIKKISYALHRESTEIARCLVKCGLDSLLDAIGVEDPVILQSMLSIKHPLISKAVMCHQDASYLHTRPQGLTGLWLALDDFTIESGALWVLPEGQKLPLKFRFLRDDCHALTYQVYDQKSWDLDKMIPLEVSKGSLIAFDGMLPHMCLANSSRICTHAFLIHVMSGKSSSCARNWLPPEVAMPLSKLCAYTERNSKLVFELRSV